MPFTENGTIRYFQFDNFEKDIQQAILTRQGGVSPAPWASLNMGGTVGDEPERVQENRQRALTALGLHQNSVYDVWQVHGISVAIADGPRLHGTPHVKADAILTNIPNITLMMRFADCVPVLIHDPVHHVVGMIHAGWLGVVSGVIPNAIKALISRFKSNPNEIIAGIGPSIGPDHYEIGKDVEDRIISSFGADSSGLLIRDKDCINLDLWAATRLQLLQTGVNQIQMAGLCTACHLNDWYSHRVEHGRTGRFGAMISMKA